MPTDKYANVMDIKSRTNDPLKSENWNFVRMVGKSPKSGIIPPKAGMLASPQLCKYAHKYFAINLAVEINKSSKTMHEAQGTQEHRSHMCVGTDVASPPFMRM